MSIKNPELIRDMRGFPGIGNPADRCPAKKQYSAERFHVEPLDSEEKLFLRQLLPGMTLAAVGAEAAMLGVLRMLESARKADGRRMFHWVDMRYTWVYVCPVSSGEEVIAGRFMAREGDASGAAVFYFEPSAAIR